jgi:hypothetical protein
MGGSLVGFLVASIFISTLYYPSFWLLMAFALTLKKACLNEIGGDITADGWQSDLLREPSAG